MSVIAAGVGAMIKLRRRLNALRNDERGGVLIVLGYAVIAVSILGILTGIAITSSMSNMNQRASQAAEASMRSAIGSILAEVNANPDTSTVVAGIGGRTFNTSAHGGTSVTTKVSAARFDGETVFVDVNVQASGRMSWTRAGTASLKLAQATSLADLDGNRAVWDFAAGRDGTPNADQYVALWTIGQMSLLDATTGTGIPAKPTGFAVTKSLVSDKATFTFTTPVCSSGTSVEFQSRTRMGTDVWSPRDGLKTKMGSIAPGQQMTAEGRARCSTASRTSEWVVLTAQIMRSTEIPAAPAVYIDIDGAGNASARAISSATPTAGFSITEQVRLRVDGGTWTTWSANSAAQIALRSGQTVDAQGRVRVASATSESGWIESTVVTLRYAAPNAGSSDPSVPTPTPIATYGPSPTPTPTPTPVAPSIDASLQYRVLRIGDNYGALKTQGETSGVPGSGVPIEDWNVAFKSGATAGGISWYGHWANLGWRAGAQLTSPANATSLTNTWGFPDRKGLQMEAISLTTTGGWASAYSVTYRVYVSGVGWTAWVADGATAGTTGQGRAIEAIEIKLVKR